MKAHKKPVRVSQSFRCPVCHKSTWCMVGDAWVVCMRVESNRPKQLSDGSTGWLHPVGEYHPPPERAPEPDVPPLDVAGVLKRWRQFKRTNLDSLARLLGVTPESLSYLECGHAPYHKTWFFPMRNGENDYTGIRLRSEDGKKWAERGSRQGLFIPQCPNGRTALIVEGPTDCAAALTIGQFALGRPSCGGGIEHLKVALKRLKFERCAIVADLDDPGLRGAQTLAMHLPVPTAILVCPAKDLRSFVLQGGDWEILEAMLDQLVWRNPKQT